MAIAIYRSWRIEVEAEQFKTPGPMDRWPAGVVRVLYNFEDAVVWGPKETGRSYPPELSVGFAVWTRGGWWLVSDGMWIVRFSDGRRAVYFDRAFHDRFDRVGEEPRHHVGPSFDPPTTPSSPPFDPTTERVAPGFDPPPVETASPELSHASSGAPLDAYQEIVETGGRKVRVTSGSMRGLPYTAITVPAGSIVEIQWRQPGGKTTFWQIHDRHRVGSQVIDKAGEDFIDALETKVRERHRDVNSWMRALARVSFGATETAISAWIDFCAQGDHFISDPCREAFSARLREAFESAKQKADVAAADALDHQRLRDLHRRIVDWCEDRDQSGPIDLLIAMRQELDRVFEADR